MTGTIRQVHVNNLFPGSTVIPPVSIGDHIAWTLHYDTNTAPNSLVSNPHEYDLNYQAVSNLVDKTTAYHFYAPPNVNSTRLVLENLIPKGGAFWTSSGLMDTRTYQTIYWLTLDLGSADALPTLNLANLSLTAPPFTPNDGMVTYQYKAFSFVAVTDSISLATAPEPGSLTLFVLGAVGAIASRLRPRIVGAGRRG
ncbi:MAG TPA: hypothetical protein VE999_19990 [Gemmataceae bacterium]|nr:hypothetical protein [Gemmataceae bacterium]